MSRTIATAFPATSSTEAGGFLTGNATDWLAVIASSESVEITLATRALWISIHPSIAEAFAHSILAAAREARRLAR